MSIADNSLHKGLIIYSNLQRKEEMVLLCVIAKIDELAEAKFVRLQNIAAQFGAAPNLLHGHITLVSYLNGNENELIAYCKAALYGQKSFSVSYDKIAVLPTTSIIVALPRKTEILLSVHNKLTANFCECLDQWTQNNIWQPHTTLLIHNSYTNLTEIVHAMQTEFEPFTAYIESIEFSRVTENGYDIIDSLNLL